MTNVVYFELGNLVNSKIALDLSNSNGKSTQLMGNDMKVDFESLDSIPSMLSDRSDLAFQPGSSGHISDHMNRQAFHLKFKTCLEFEPSSKFLKSRAFFMMSFWVREVEIVEKMFLIKNSGCRWTQTSLQMSRRRKQDLYLRFEY